MQPTRLRRRSSLAAIACGAALLAGWTSDTALAGPVRVFVVGHRHQLGDAESVASFRAKMLALMDARERHGDLVQRDVDDVASHLSTADPAAPRIAVVHFPEATGLIAGLIGSRGAAARESSAAVEAFATLLGSYTEPIRHYEARYPEVASEPIRGLVLALTDILYRSVYETFREIAVRYGVYVSVNLDAAPARRVEASVEPDLVSTLRDPDEPDRTYAYEATTALPQNVVLLFEPSGEVLVSDGQGGLRRSPSETDGEILPSTAKVYLTPIEQELDKPGGGLSLASASPRDLEVLPTAVGAIGVLVSKDAWMVDLNERLDTKGAQVILQSEAFDSWAFVTDPWSPDVFAKGGVANLQRRSGFLFNITPSLVGNLFDVTFDSQSAILAKRREKRFVPRPGAAAGFLGQPAQSGFLSVSPWIVADPPPELRPGERSLAARRAALVSRGVALLPGSGIPCPDPSGFGACENGYRESILWTDLDLPESAAEAPFPVDRTLARTSFGASKALRAIAAGHQRHPRAAAAGSVVAVTWDERPPGERSRVMLAISRDQGATFESTIAVSDGSRAALGDELHPDVTVAADAIHVAWQAFDEGSNDDTGRIESARVRFDGVRAGDVVRVDGDAATGSMVEAGRWLPRIAVLRDGSLFVAWIDERDRGPDGVALAHVYGARGEAGGTRFAEALRIDAGAPPVALSESLDHRWAPAVAADGEIVHVAWTDFREYDWDIFATRSLDGGRSFAPSRKLSSACQFCDVPEIAVWGGQTILAWTDLGEGPPDSNLFRVWSTDDGATFSADGALDDSRRGRIASSPIARSSQDHVSLAAASGAAGAGPRSPAGGLFASWQDDRGGNQDILFAAIDPRSRAVVRAERVDDSGGGPSNQYRPALAAAGSGADAICNVFWEDDRAGWLRIYAARRSCEPRSDSRRPVPSLARRAVR